MYRVYLADDEYLVVRGLERRINWQRLNCQVVGCAQDGVTALNEILELKPDIVITDILMPEMNGLDVIREAAMQIHCAYIVFSGHSEFNYARQALQLGTVDYLIKPVNIEEIEKSILKAQERLEQSGFHSASLVAPDQYAEMQMMRLLDGFEADTRSLEGYGVFLTAVIRCEGDGAQALREEMKALENPVCRVFLVMDKSALILVAAAREERNIVYFRKRLAAQMGKLRRDDSALYWGLGHLCDGAKELSSSYARANEMLNYCLFTGQQIDETYALTRYEPADYRDWVRDVAALALQEGDGREAENGIRRLLQDAVARKLSARAVIDLCADLIYEIRQILEKTSGETAAKGGFCEPFSASELGEAGSLERMERYLIEKVRCMREFALGRSLQMRQGQIDRIRAYIGQKLAAPLTLSDIADSVRMNPSYVSHIFKKETGCNLFEYIAQARMERAQELLRTTDWRIAQISREVGYEDQRYFCQVFKKQLGITATEYRNAAAGQQPEKCQK